MMRAHEHDVIVTIDRMGTATPHDTMADAIEHKHKHGDCHVYWAEYTPITDLPCQGGWNVDATVIWTLSP